MGFLNFTRRRRTSSGTKKRRAASRAVSIAKEAKRLAAEMVKVKKSKTAKARRAAYKNVMQILGGFGTLAGVAYGAKKAYGHYSKNNSGHPPLRTDAQIKSGKASQTAMKASSDATRKALTAQKKLDYNMKKAARTIQNNYRRHNLRQAVKGIKTFRRESAENLKLEALKNRTRRREHGVEVLVKNQKTGKEEWVKGKKPVVAAYTHKKKNSWFENRKGKLPPSSKKKRHVDDLFDGLGINFDENHPPLSTEVKYVPNSEGSEGEEKADGH